MIGGNMNKLTWRFFGWGALAILFAGLVGCNFPGRAPETPPAIQYTQAAETVAAQLTAVAQSATKAPERGHPTAVSPTSWLTAQPSFAPTDTPSPIATSTLAPTPTENLKLLFSDDFSKQVGWYTEKGEDFSFEFIADGYRIYVNIANANIWSIRDKTYTDIVLEVEAARMAGPVDGYYGLLCRQVDKDNYYALVIGSNGFYGIGKMAKGDFAFLQEDQDTKGVINSGATALNKIRADCIGDTLRLYANGQMLMEVQDSDFQEGVTGLVVGTRKQPGLDVLFDNFATYQPIQ
jgi:hypothetical protein